MEQVFRRWRYLFRAIPLSGSLVSIHFMQSSWSFDSVIWFPAGAINQLHRQKFWIFCTLPLTMDVIYGNTILKNLILILKSIFDINCNMRSPSSWGFWRAPNPIFRSLESPCDGNASLGALLLYDYKSSFFYLLGVLLGGYLVKLITAAQIISWRR